MIGLLAAVFEPPSTKDFVFGCWGGSFKLFGFDTCFNFIIMLCVLTTIIVVTLFYFSLRRPAVVPGKFQLLAELGVDFVRENVAVPMLGQDAAKFMPLLASFFASNRKYSVSRCPAYLSLMSGNLRRLPSRLLEAGLYGSFSGGLSIAVQ